jgi:protein-S-isoprenylcysteine O-methyltransferase Ste14
MNSQKAAFIDKILLVKPTHRMAVEWPILVIVAVLGEVFSWSKIPFSPYSNIIGGVVIAGAWMFHAYCHRAHRKAHQQSGSIDSVVNTGVFSRIRHPMYLSLILMYFGFAIAWGVLWILLPAFLFSILTVFTAIREEEFLLRKLGSQYEEYIRAVPWRFISKVF